MERIQFNSIVCKLWSEAPIEYSREEIKRIFSGCVAPKILVQALHLFDNQQLDAVINLINCSKKLKTDFCKNTPYITDIIESKNIFDNSISIQKDMSI